MAMVQQSAKIFRQVGERLGGATAYALGYNASVAGQKLAHLPGAGGRIGESLATVGRTLEERHLDYVASSYKLAALGRVAAAPIKMVHQ